MNRWATVTQVSPLRIRLDGEDAPLPITPDSVATGLRVGSRVLASIVGRRIVVHGASMPPPVGNVLRLGGFLLQWGTIAGVGTATFWTGGHNFAVPFSSAPALTLGSPDNNADSSIIYNVRSRTAVGFTWSAQWLETAPGDTDAKLGLSHSFGGVASWIAIGPA